MADLHVDALGERLTALESASTSTGSSSRASSSTSFRFAYKPAKPNAVFSQLPLNTPALSQYKEDFMKARAAARLPWALCWFKFARIVADNGAPRSATICPHNSYCASGVPLARSLLHDLPRGVDSTMWSTFVASAAVKAFCAHICAHPMVATDIRQNPPPKAPNP